MCVSLCVVPFCGFVVRFLWRAPRPSFACIGSQRLLTLFLFVLVFFFPLHLLFVPQERR